MLLGAEQHAELHASLDAETFHDAIAEDKWYVQVVNIIVPVAESFDEAVVLALEVGKARALLAVMHAHAQRKLVGGLIFHIDTSHDAGFDARLQRLCLIHQVGHHLVVGHIGKVDA